MFLEIKDVYDKVHSIDVHQITNNIFEDEYIKSEHEGCAVYEKGTHIILANGDDIVTSLTIGQVNLILEIAQIKLKLEEESNGR